MKSEYIGQKTGEELIYYLSRYLEKFKYDVKYDKPIYGIFYNNGYLFMDSPDAPAERNTFLGFFYLFNGEAVFDPIIDRKELIPLFFPLD